MNSNDLCIPIYLNQQAVFDLLAIFDDGFSRLSTIKTSVNESMSEKASAGGSIGASNVFALLGITFSGERTKGKDHTGQREVNQEKVHTPTSLFATLRARLQEQNLLKGLEERKDFDELKNGDFVEFEAVLKKNPLVDTIEGFKQLVEIADGFQEEGLPTGKSQQRSPKPKNPNLAIMKQMDSILKALSQGGSVEIIGDLASMTSTKAVLSAKLDFFSAGGTDELIDGEFRVLGKIVRVASSEESINLLRKTTFNRFERTIIDQMTAGFQGSDLSGLSFPELTTEIRGPSIQVIPIAIFR
jgi:hypothetical protein